MFRLQLSLIAVLTAGVAAAAPPPPARIPLSQRVVTTWTDREGLPQNSPLSLAQTPDGYLWIATEEGLVRFDGTEFFTYDQSTTPRLPSERTRSIHVSRDGVLWVASAGGATRMTPPSRTFTTREGLASNYVNAIHTSADGSTWFGTTSGISRLKGGTMQRIDLPAPTQPVVSAFTETDDGTVVIASDAGVFVYTKGVVARLVVTTGPPSPERAITATGNVVWVGWAGDGVTRYDLRTGVTHTFKEELRDTNIYALHAAADGSILIGTNGGGLQRIVGDVVDSLPAQHALHDGQVWSVFEDRDRNIWAGPIGKGLARLSPPLFANLGEAEGLSHPIALAVLAASDGTLWVGTAGGGVNQVDGTVVRSWSVRDGLRSLVISLAEDAQRRIWIGGPRGIARIENGKVVDVLDGTRLRSPIVRAIAPAADGSVYIGTQGGGLEMLRGNVVTPVASASELGSQVVTALHWSRQRDLIIMTEGGGLSRLHKGVIERIGGRDVAQLTVYSLHEEQNGTMWLATGERGIARLTNGRFTFFGTDRGLSDDGIHAVIDDGADGIWYSSNTGVYRVRKTDLLRNVRVIRPRRFGRAHGLRSLEFNGGISPAVARFEDGRIWFPSIAGVAGVDPHTLRVVRQPAKPMITRVVIDGVEASDVSSITLPPGTKSVEIRYASIDLTAPELLAFRHRLQGFDESWSVAGSGRAAYYTNLPPGDYILHIQALTADGSLAATRSVPFDVRAHFWQLTSFRVAAGLALLAAALALHAIRVRRINRHNRELAEHIAERREVETRLREAEAHFRSLIENTSDMIFTLDDDGIVRYASPGTRRILGFEPASIAGESIFTLLDPDEPEAKKRAFRATLQQEHLATDHFRARGSDGATFLLETIGSTREAADGTREVVLNCRDITERVLIQEELHRAARMAGLGRLAAGVSHEFNNVLMGIQPIADLLQRSTDESSRSFGARISGSVARGRQITSEILSYARPPEPQPEPFDASKWLHDLLPELQSRAPEIPISLDAASSAFILGDKLQLTQVVVNLAVNASDSMSKNGGTLHISCRPISPDALPRPSATAQPMIELTVRDEGEGIAEEALPKIFEPLYTTKRRSGTGLGLAIVHQIVAMHGGRIAVESTVGEGTTFRVLLPAAEDATVAAERPVRLAEIPAGVRRVVVVEDHADVAAAVVALIEHHGRSARVAVNGKAAAELLLDERPDVMIVDLGLPDTDGLTLYRELERRFGEIPVVFYTGGPSPDLQAESLTKPHISFIRKPFTEQTLISALAQASTRTG